MVENGLVERISAFLESEARSCSMDPGCVTAEYVYRMWGGMVPFAEIAAALPAARVRLMNAD